MSVGLFMLIYPHPLDYVTGLKYTVTDGKLPVEFELSSETFHVLELVDLNEAGFSAEKGEYAVLKLWKKDIEMFKAVEIVSRRLRIPASSIYFYGIKDKHACTESYLFIKSHLLDQSLLPLLAKNIRVELIGFIRSKPKRAMFKGNRFRVVIESTDPYRMASLLEEMVRTFSGTGLLGYYGYQRFGWKRYNSHILGKYMLLGREDMFAEEFLKTLYPTEDAESTLKRYLGVYANLAYERLYVKTTLSQGLEAIAKKVRNVFIDAYYSYLFNLLINLVVEKEGLNALSAESLPMPGCHDNARYYKYYERIARIENIDLSLLTSSNCFYRQGAFRPINNIVNLRSGHIIYEFVLRPGMYATVVLRELFKDNLVLGGETRV